MKFAFRQSFLRSLTLALALGCVDSARANFFAMFAAPPPTSVPEVAGTFALVALSLAGLVALRRKYPRR